MRIVYVCLEDLAKPGGGKVHFWALSLALRTLGHDILVVSPQFSSKTIPYPAGIEGKTFRVPGKNAFSVFLFELLLLINVPILKKQIRPNAILVRGGPAILMGLVFHWARLWGIRTVLECNSVLWEEYRSYGAGKLFCSFVEWGARAQARAASALIGVTPSILEAFSLNEERCWSYAISNGANAEEYDLSRRHELRSYFGLRDDEIVLVMPSSFTPWHGIDEAIDSLSFLPEFLKPNVSLIMIGDGTLFDEARKRAAVRNETDHILFTGMLPHEKVIEWLIASDIGLFLCNDPGKLRYPGSPLKLFEYFAAGLAVIVPDDPYHGKLNAFYRIGETVPQTSPQHIANAIVALCNEASYQKIGAQNRILCEGEFTWKRVAERVQSVLQGRKPQLEKWLLSTPTPKRAGQP